jgi:hypothetical protein
LSWVGADVWLGTSSISCIIGDAACGVSGSMGWRIGRSVGCCVGSGVDLLHYFVFTSSFFNH